MHRQKTIQKIQTNTAPPAIGPYSQGVRAGDFIFISGQIPVDPAGNMITGDIAAQTHQVIRNIEAIATVAGASLKNIVKTTIYLNNIADFTKVNSVYEAYFKNILPARAAVEVAALPKNAAIEMEAVLYLPAEHK
jgi:2-iminobutanoate/2-iminopropanoate deaminase